MLEFAELMLRSAIQQFSFDSSTLLAERSYEPPLLRTPKDQFDDELLEWQENESNSELEQESSEVKR